MFNLFLKSTQIFAAIVLVNAFIFFLSEYIYDRPLLLVLLGLFGFAALHVGLKIKRSDENV